MLTQNVVNSVQIFTSSDEFPYEVFLTGYFRGLLLTGGVLDGLFASALKIYL